MPGDALLASFGCGNPTALAERHPGSSQKVEEGLKALDGAVMSAFIRASKSAAAI